MSPTEAPAQAIGVLNNRIGKLIAEDIAIIERSTLAWYDNLVAKYGSTLRTLKTERESAVTRLEKHLTELGYG